MCVCVSPPICLSSVTSGLYLYHNIACSTRTAGRMPQKIEREKKPDCI